MSDTVLKHELDNDSSSDEEIGCIVGEFVNKMESNKRKADDFINQDFSAEREEEHMAKLRKFDHDKKQELAAVEHYDWNEQLENILARAVHEIQNDWKAVEEFCALNIKKINENLPLPTAAQCAVRWKYFLDPTIPLRRGPWSEEEMEMLKTEVLERKRRIESSEFPEKHISWSSIARKLSRDHKETTQKWLSIERTQMIKGPFTPEEDAYLARRVPELLNDESKKHGIWSTLQREMRRKDKRISERWRLKLSKVGEEGVTIEEKQKKVKLETVESNQIGDKSLMAVEDSSNSDDEVALGVKNELPVHDLFNPNPNPVKENAEINTTDVSNPPKKKKTDKNGEEIIHIRWTFEDDLKLAEAISIFGKNWKRVADYVGNGANNIKCRKHWVRSAHKVYKAAEVLKTRNEDGTPAEEKQAAEGVSSALFESFRENASIMSKVSVTKPGSNFPAIEYKKGPFSAEEDEYVIQRVKEWVNQKRGNGIWVALQKEMGRKDKRISERWRFKLSKRVEETEGIVIDISNFSVGKKSKVKDEALNMSSSASLFEGSLVQDRILPREHQIETAMVPADDIIVSNVLAEQSDSSSD